MEWKDIACIVFVCVTMNHLGLIAAIERVIKRKLWIIDCPKCLTCWSVFAYGIATVPCGSPQGIAAALPTALAISFLCAYLAIWLELAEGFIDLLYIKVYEQIYPATNPPDPDPPNGEPSWRLTGTTGILPVAAAMAVFSA